MVPRLFPLVVLSIFCLTAGKVRAQQSRSEKKSVTETAHADDAGLLLGAYFPNDGTWDMLTNDPEGQKWVPEVSPEPHGKYLTFWISRIGGTAKIQSVEGLLVPRANGFWRVGTRIVHASQEPGSDYEEQFWAAPAGEKPKPAAADSEMDRGSVRLVTYAGPDYLAYLTHCQCGAGAWDYVFSNVASLDDLPTDASIQKVLGPTVGANYKRLAKSLDHTNEEPAEGEACNCCTSDEKEWGILHVGDSWQAYARFHQGTSSSCYQGSEDRALKAAIPKSIALPVTLNRPWDVVRAEAEAVLKTQPGAIQHLFVSPKRDLAVAVGTNGLAVLGVANGRITSVLKAQAFDAPYIPVMEQWSLGRFVGTWDAAVQKELPAVVPKGDNP